MNFSQSSSKKKLKETHSDDEEEDLEGDGNSEKVERPTWGSFRKFWTDCELTITPLSFDRN